MSERPRMSREQLNEARRTVAELVRRKPNVSSKRPKDPAPSEPGESRSPSNQTLHLSLEEPDLRNLDAIVELLKRHPIHGRLHANIGRQKAARFAIAYCVEHAAGRVTTV